MENKIVYKPSYYSAFSNHKNDFPKNEESLRLNIKELNNELDKLSTVSQYYDDLGDELERIIEIINGIDEKTIGRPYNTIILEKAFDKFVKVNTIAVKDMGINIKYIKNHYNIYSEQESMYNSSIFNLDELKETYADLLYKFKHPEEFTNNYSRTIERQTRLKYFNKIKKFFKEIHTNVEEMQTEISRDIEELDDRISIRENYLKSNEFRQRKNMLYNYFKNEKQLSNITKNMWNIPESMNFSNNRTRNNRNNHNNHNNRNNRNNKTIKSTTRSGVVYKEVPK